MTLRARFRDWLMAGVTPAAPQGRTPMKVRLDEAAPAMEDPFTLPKPPPGVVPAGIAMDSACLPNGVSAWAQTYQNTLFAEGWQFMGYPYLSYLTQVPEYRRPAETIAKEMTRKWIKLVATGDDKKDELITALEAAMKKFKVQDAFRRVAELDGFFGRAHIYIDTGKSDDPRALKTPLVIDPRTVKQGSLRGLRVVEPMWTYPYLYNSDDPLHPHYYKPTSWFVMGKEISATRLLTFVSREMPDILKPAYSFGGLSLSQMMKPYVDNWLQTRQSVSDIIHRFSVSVLSTNMQGTLGIGGPAVFDRAKLFALTRDNNGLMMLDKDTEEFSNVSTPLTTLDILQAQSQEHMAAVCGIPLTILLGITPSGLNASSEGEIRTFYAWIEAQQEDMFTDALTKVLNILQLNEFGAIDPEIGFEYVPLWALSADAEATMDKTIADTDGVYIDKGVLSPDEVRMKLATREDSPYAGLDLDSPAPEPPEPEVADEGDQKGDEDVV